MQRNFNAPKDGYSTQSYIETLKQGSFLISNVLSFSCRTTHMYTHRMQPEHDLL
jgi:hypothetical protein